jgi:oxygen-independent coproporphyrinogen III oxidase
MTILDEYIVNNPYHGYAYSYPHKTSYRAFSKPIPLKELWSRENRQSLFLYIHVPFCEMRCGFCNLFTMANPAQDRVTQYLQALERQSRVVKDSIGDATFTQLAVGGGTPSFLHEGELEKMFSIIENIMGARPSQVPMSFEVSPKTVSRTKLKYLFDKGVDRISIGIQSFLEVENKMLGRPQRDAEVYSALEQIKEQNFQTFNIDLIYGGAGQTADSWNFTLRKTLEFSPEEIYLYPLYVRPLTGLDKMGMSWDNFRLHLYRQGRDHLLDNGYEQVSMRMFRKKTQDQCSKNNISYCCQEDGMVGLGSGARSYTEEIHYSTEYAVGRRGVVDIINSYVHETDDDFSLARYGIRLSEDEQKRRYCIKSLLHNEGLNPRRYKNRFSSDVFFDFPELNSLVSAGMAFFASAGELSLTASGMELSDSIGPWMYSKDIERLMANYDLR